LQRFFVGTRVANGAGQRSHICRHVLGGTIPPHEIGPNKAKALAVGGKQVFAKRVNLSAVTMPERSYLRSSLAEMAGEIAEGLEEAVAEAVR
jgi:hypothetical protein